MVMDAFTPWTIPVGVPELDGAALVELLLVGDPALPQPTSIPNAITRAAAKTSPASRNFLLEIGKPSAAATRKYRIAKGARRIQSKSTSNTSRSVAPTPEDAVLANVRVAVVVPFAGRVNALSVQEILSELAMPHVVDARLPAPVSPFLLANVRVVDVDWSGLMIVRAVGFAVTLNVGLDGGKTVKLAAVSLPW